MKSKYNLTILMLGLIAILVFSTLTLVQTAAQSPDMDKLFGSWNVTATVEGQGFTFPALITFGADGTVIADEPPLPGETSAHGNWLAGDDGAVAYTFVALYSGEEGAYAGRLKVVGALQYDSGGDRWQGPFKIDVFDADDQVAFSDTGTFDMTRIAVETLD